MSDRRLSRDFREFVFTATGRETNPRRLDPEDLDDNLTAELVRLRAIVELLECAGDALEPEALSGVSLLLRDVHNRAAAILASWRDGSRGRQGSA